MSNNQDPIFAANSARRASQRKQGSGMGKRVANELCPTCHGAGSMAHTASSQPCRTCRGEGLIARTAEWDGASCKSCGKNNFPDARRCAHCGVPHPGDAPVGKKKKASRRTAGRTSVEFYRDLGGAGYWTFYDLANNQYGSYESEAEAAAAASIWEGENPTMEDFLTAPGPYTLGSRRTAAGPIHNDRYDTGIYPAQAPRTSGPRCSCAQNSDGTVTTMMCPLHADDDPCVTIAAVTGRRRQGSIVNGTCTNCGWSAAPTFVASRRTAVSLTNVGFEGGIGSNTAHGYTADGRKVIFRLSDQDAKDLANVMTSDLAINFSGVDVDEADIISTSSRRTAADVTPNENGEKTLRNGWVNMKGEGKVFRPDLAQLLIDMAKADSGLLSEGGRRDSHPLVPSTEDFCRDMVARGEPWVSECPNPFCRDGVHLECSGIQCDCPCHAFGFNEMGFLSSRKTAGYRYMTADEVARWRAGEYFPGAEEDANGVLFSVTDPDMGDFGLGDDDDPAMILASRRTADQNFGPAPDSQSGFGESERDWVTVDNATDDSNLGWISNEPEEAYEMDPGFGPFDDID